MIEYFYLWFIFSLFGAWIGQRKKRIAEGFLAGLLLGPIGLIWIALQKPKEKCPECSGVIDKDVKKCKHCGSDLNK